MLVPFTFSPDYGKPPNVREALLQKLRNDADLFALGSSVARVVQLASSEDEATHSLAYYVLSDVALTQKILRIANTITYRASSSSKVTTISRAIFLLGFDTVKTTALAMLLVDGLSNGKHAQSVRTELAEALCASLVGRELARRSPYQGAEEASIAALFKNLGRLLVASHEHARYREIANLVDAGKHTPMQAAVQVLGCSFDLLAESVLQEWQMPDMIVQAMGPVPVGIQKPHKNRQEWVRQVASFSAEAAKLIPHMARPDTQEAIQGLLKRFGAALSLDQDKVTQIFSTVVQEIQLMGEDGNLGLFQVSASAEPDEIDVGGLPSVLQLAMMDAGAAKVSACHPSGKPVNARSLLLVGVQDVTQMMASGRCKVNDLILLVLETLYNSLGFRFATVCMKDLKSNQFRARISLGEHCSERQSRFMFPATTDRDLFHLAMDNDADLMIADAASPKIRALIPAWHRNLLPDAASFIVLPLVVQKIQLGMFYADRAQPAPEGVPPDETALIKTLKGQVLAAITPR